MEKIKKALKSILLAIALLVITLPFTSYLMTETVYAEGNGEGDDAGESSGSLVGGPTASKAGYIVYIVNEDGVPVTDAKMMTNSEIPAGPKYIRPRIGGGAVTEVEYPYKWGQPYTESGDGRGTEIKQWFLAMDGAQMRAATVIEQLWGKETTRAFAKNDQYLIIEAFYWARTDVGQPIFCGTSYGWGKYLQSRGKPNGWAKTARYTNNCYANCMKFEKDQLGWPRLPHAGKVTASEQMTYATGLISIWSQEGLLDESLQTTCDESLSPTEHRAPDESVGTYRIIKFYEEQESDGAIQPLVNYTRKGVTNKIQVENEKDWELIKWDKSTNYYGKKGSGLENEILNALSSYDEVVGTCGSTGGGAGTSLVTLTEKVDTTL